MNLKEFRDGVVRVARGREPGVTVEQIARVLGCSSDGLVHVVAPGRYRRWGEAGPSRAGSAEVQEARKWVRLLAQENQVLRWAAVYRSQVSLLEEGFTRW